MTEVGAGGHVEVTTDEDPSLDTEEKSEKWELFEKMIAVAEKELDQSSDVAHDARIMGNESGTLRQIDVFARGNVVRAPMNVVIECKHYNRKLGIGKVDELIGKLKDVGAHHGILYAYSGVTEPARKRAAGARMPTVEIRDFDETLAALAEAEAERKRAGTSITFQELLANVAEKFGEDLARSVERHFTYNCEAGTGCHGVVDMDSTEDEVAWGECDVCSSLHLRCECCESAIYVHGVGHPEACWCSARYSVLFTPNRDLHRIDQLRHGDDCDQKHSAAG